jgi:hypothetical protein
MIMQVTYFPWGALAEVLVDAALTGLTGADCRGIKNKYEKRYSPRTLI